MRIFNIPTKRTMSTQSQRHGFKVENIIRKNVFKIDNQCNDTNIHNIPFDKNTLDPNENVSIKTFGV